MILEDYIKKISNDIVDEDKLKSHIEFSDKIKKALEKVQHVRKPANRPSIFISLMKK